MLQVGDATGGFRLADTKLRTLQTLVKGSSKRSKLGISSEDSIKLEGFGIFWFRFGPCGSLHKDPSLETSS